MCGKSFSVDYYYCTVLPHIAEYRYMVIHRVIENGEETVTVEENGVLTSKTIGGVQQAITGRK